ncbi:MAG: LysM peptidoglycan-binding domain-containing protein [Thermodesulfobacteriota bacterium]|nr:LysM peptidoglycan-binding domain-containing protein [Thermodesulfobacteriota bacterium]
MSFFNGYENLKEDILTRSAIMKPIKMFFMVLVLLWSWSATGLTDVRPVDDPFPLYPCIRPNVNFWVKVYTKEPSTRGFIHDSTNLDIIYDVIDVKKQDEPGARKINKKRIKAAKKKYKRILGKLAGGVSPSTDEEKRVLALFRDNPKSSTLRKARDNVRFQRGQKDRFLPGLIRSGGYLREMKKIFSDYGLPTDLTYLPHVESSFNYKAYSKFGAAGVWQFTRSTGKRFLRLDYALDERRDPIRSTHAAAIFLKENHERLGSWPLALTAYNHGTAGMARAKKAKGGYERIFKEYTGRRFRFASRNFYSEFLAARKVAENYGSFFGNVRFDRPKRTTEVELPGYAPIHELADYFEVDLTTVRELNPALRNPVYKGHKYVPKGYRLRLPDGRGQKTEQLAARMPEDFFLARQKHSRFYSVQKGDTAGKIAIRHGVKLKNLILANRLNRHATIYVGQNLRIPTRDEKITRLAKVLEKSSSVKQKVAPPVGATASRVAKAKSENDRTELSVPPAVNLGRPVAEIAMPEKPTTALISSKQSAWERDALKPVASKPEVPESSEPKPELNPEPKPAETEQVEIIQTAVAAEMTIMAIIEVNPAVVSGHLQVEKLIKRKGKTLGVIRVEVGETLGHYAEWLGVSTQEIRRLNNIRFGKKIRINQSLNIPFQKTGSEEFEEKRYEYHKEVEEDFFTSFQVQGMRTYEIRKGDNIWTLCRAEFDMPFWLVKKYNPALDFNGLMPDQKIQIPVVMEIRKS